MTYIALSCLWATAGTRAWEKLPELLAIAASGVILPIAVRDLPIEDLPKIRRALLAGIAGGIAFCFGDILAGEPFKIWHKGIPDLGVNAYDREIIALGLLLWPAALILSRRGWRVWAVAALAAYSIAIQFFQSHSAMTGMALGLVALGVGSIAPRLVRLAMTALSGAGFALCIPAAFLMKRHGLDQWDRLQFSFRHRIQIWSFTAERILHWPLFGLGLEGSRAIPTGDLAPGFLPLGQDKPPLHPHNFFLQIWLELGFVGVILAFAFMAALIGAIRKLPGPAQGYALGAAASFLAIATFAFGITQGWWLAALAFLVLTVLLAARQETTDK
jgi:O-antigen ligase